MMTPTDAARALNVSERTVRREIEAGRLRAIKVRSMYRIRSEDLESYLEEMNALARATASEMVWKLTGCL